MKKTITIVSDLHVGSSLGLCPREGLQLGEAGMYLPSPLQLSVWGAWESFIEWSLRESEGAESASLVTNGDVVEGVHHNTVALATSNIQVQEAGAIAIISQAAKRYDKLYMIRGTEAHVQPSAQSEERIATACGAEISEDGLRSWWQLWLEVDGVVINLAHHIGTTSSAAYESSAVMRELVAAIVEAGQWGQRLPDVVVRSHRHRFIKLSIPSQRGEIQAVVTPGWQLRTPFVERVDRMRLPHIGGLILIVEDGRCQVRHKIYPMKTQEPVRV